MKILLIAFAFSLFGLIGCGWDPDQAIKEGPSQTVSIRRLVATPSGDWGASIDYTYDKDGKLCHISQDFCTFAGYDKGSDEFKSTRCIRNYEVSETGKLLLKSKRITDLATGKPAEREFFEPEIVHWMTLSEAQQGLQAEQTKPSNP